MSAPTGTDSAKIIRSLLYQLQKFMQAFEYTRMKPVKNAALTARDNYFVRMLAEPGKQYAVYLNHSEPRGKQVDGVILSKMTKVQRNELLEQPDVDISHLGLRDQNEKAM